MNENDWTITDPVTNKRVTLTQVDVYMALRGALSLMEAYVEEVRRGRTSGKFVGVIDMDMVRQLERDLLIIKTLKNKFKAQIEAMAKEFKNATSNPPSDPAVIEQAQSDALGNEGEAEGFVHLVDQKQFTAALHAELHAEDAAEGHNLVERPKGNGGKG